MALRNSGHTRGQTSENAGCADGVSLRRSSRRGFARFGFRAPGLDDALAAPSRPTGTCGMDSTTARPLDLLAGICHAGRPVGRL